MRNTSLTVLPIPENAFFEQAVFDQDLSQGLLELARLSLELLDLVRGGLTRRVAGEPFLARLQELLRPTVVQVLIDPFLAAQLSNAVLATQAFQHDADLLFSGMMPACGSANIPGCLFSALRYALGGITTYTFSVADVNSGLTFANHGNSVDTLTVQEILNGDIIATSQTIMVTDPPVSDGGTIVSEQPASATGEHTPLQSTSADNHVIVGSPFTETLSGKSDSS